MLVSWMAEVGSLHVPVLGEQIILRLWGGDASQSTCQGLSHPYEFSIRCFARCEPAACWQLWCSPGTPQPKRRVLARAISRGLSHNSQSPLIASERYLNDTRGSWASLSLFDVHLPRLGFLNVLQMSHSAILPSSTKFTEPHLNVAQMGFIDCSLDVVD